MYLVVLEGLLVSQQNVGAKTQVAEASGDCVIVFILFYFNIAFVFFLFVCFALFICFLCFLLFVSYDNLVWGFLVCSFFSPFFLLHHTALVRQPGVESEPPL